MANVEKVQAGYKAQTLSAFAKQPPPPAPPAVSFPKIDKDLVKTNFFEYVDFALRFAPPRPEEKEIRAKLARIGIGPDKTFDFKELSLAHKAEIALGMKAGEGKVEQAVAGLGKRVNGWQIGSIAGDGAFFNGDWLKRATLAKAGIYGNDAAEAVYPMTTVDARGEKLDGSKHDYTLTFPAGQFPPVHAFWSVTMYDGKTQLLIENPINRYLSTLPCCRSSTRTATVLSPCISRRTRRPEPRRPTGFRRRTVRSTWSCDCTGRKIPRRRSCRPVRGRGSRPASKR